MRQQALLALALASASLVSQSAFAYYCSTQQGRGYINVGDTTAKVQNTCGKPSQTSTQEVPDNNFQTTQYLMYANINVSTSVPLGVQPQSTSVTKSGPSVVFQVKDGKVTAITQSGKQVKSTSACGGTVSVGASGDSVLSTCGNPSSSNMQNESSQNTKKITTWTYDMGSNRPSLVLQFDEKGKLTNIGQ